MRCWRAPPGVATMQGETIQYPSMMFYMQNVDLGAALGDFGKLNALIEEHFQAEGLPRKSGNIIPTGRVGEVLVAMSRVSIGARPVDAAEADELTMGEMAGASRRRGSPTSRCATCPASARRSSPTPRRAWGSVRRARSSAATSSTRMTCSAAASSTTASAGRRGPSSCTSPAARREWKFLDQGLYYTVPYRCLLPRELDNLLVAGRCISAKREAFASVRVIGPCMSEGQAAAVAAQVATASGAMFPAIDIDAVRIRLTALGALV